MRDVLTGLTALALVLAGCSIDSTSATEATRVLDSPATAPDAPATPDAPAQIDSADQIDSPTPTPAPSRGNRDTSTASLDPSLLPFDAVLVELLGTADVPAYLAELELVTSELTAACIRTAGFQLDLPVPPIVRASGPETETREFASAEGFGLVSSFRQAIEAASRSTGDIDETNRLYLQTLTAAQLEQFFMTLNGAPAEPGQLATDPGCNGKASDEAYATWVGFLAALPQYTAIGEERDTHPDWLAARDLWHTCMVDRGFDYDDPDAIRTDVATRMEAALIGDGETVVIETNDGVTFSPQIESLFEEMLAFERNAATANFECNEPLLDKFTAVDQEVQQSFVDRNRSTIDKLLAAN